VKLRLEQLPEALRKHIAPVYLISGDEPLQLGEAADAIREAARAKGYLSRELFYADGSFEWSRLLEAGESYSLFGEQRILDLRLPAKPDKAGSEALVRYAERLPDDAVLIVSLPKLSADEQKKSRWFQALEPKGVFIQVWPLEGAQLIAWLDRRLGSRNMLADRSGLGILAARVEGNLLAAAQEIEKLHILYGSVRVDEDMIRKAVADSARYDVYDLAESAVQGQLPRAARILSALRAEGIASAVALWAIAREVRLVAAVQAAVAEGSAQDAAFARLRVWDNRKAGLVKALQRLGRREVREVLLLCAKADRTIKGQEPGEDWDALLEICMALAGRPTAPPASACVPPRPVEAQRVKV